MMDKFKEINWLKIIKITVGAVISAVIAYSLGLQFAVSAGVICLLTIQDTRKETLAITFKRVIAFAMVTALCCLFFGIFGYNFISLGVVICLFLIFTTYFGMNEAIAMNSVIATHYFASADCSVNMIGNEVLLLAAGAGIGVLLNIFVPVNIRKIKAVQNRTDEHIKGIIGRMSIYILAEDKSDYTGSCFDEAQRLLTTLKSESVKYIGNSFGGYKDYYYKYVQMRIKQCDILMNIYTDIVSLNPVADYGRPISAFLDKMSGEFHEINDAAGLLENIDQLFLHYSEKELPKSRSEFESRALMYHILWDLKRFVKIKADFAASLSENEKNRYWNM